MVVKPDSLPKPHDNIFVRLLAAVPELSVYYGINEIDGCALPVDDLSDYSEQGIEDRFCLVDGLIDELTAMPIGDSSSETSITSQTIKFFLEYVMQPGSPLRGAAAREFAGHSYPFDHLAGVQITLPELLTKTHALNGKDGVDAHIARLSKIPEALNQAMDVANDRARRNVLPPISVFNRTLAGLREFLDLPAWDNPLFASLAHRLGEFEDLSCKDREHYLAKAHEVVEGAIYPAYANLYDVVGEHRDKAGEGNGLCAFGDGEAYYAFLLKSQTSLDLSPEDIHDLGRQELNRVQDRIREISGGGASAFPQDQLEGPNLVSGARRYVDEILGALSAVFGMLPTAPLRVREVPEALGAHQFHHYNAPGANGSRPGVFSINPAMPLTSWELPSLVYHESYPGHHLQISLAQEAKHLPAFRRYVPMVAYTEGWAKYAEMLPWDQGLVDNPAGKFGQLKSELNSSVNLVLDTGLHFYGWDRDTGTRFFQDQTGSSRDFALAMVDRILAYPAQACAYKIGMGTMLSLRGKMRDALGSQYNIRNFHSAVLSCGAVPLFLLEQIIDHAISAGVREGESKN